MYEEVDALIKAGVHTTHEMIVTASINQRMDIVALLVRARRNQTMVQTKLDVTDRAVSSNELMASQLTIKEQLTKMKNHVPTESPVEQTDLDLAIDVTQQHYPTS